MVDKIIHVTEEERKRLRELKKIFNVKTLSNVIEPALAFVAAHKDFETKTPVRGDNATFKTVHLLLYEKIVALVERYSLANFRDFTNTIRFLINMSYENIDKYER